MSYVYANPNPKKRNANDCVVRAIALALDRSWEEVYMNITYQGLMMYDMPSSNATWESYLIEHGFVKSLLPDTCPMCYTVRDFCMDYPIGKYILSTGTHVLYSEKGDYYDTTDSGSEIITSYFTQLND